MNTTSAIVLPASNDLAVKLIDGLAIAYEPAELPGDLRFTGSVSDLDQLVWRYVTPYVDYVAGRYLTAATATADQATEFDQHRHSVDV